MSDADTKRFFWVALLALLITGTIAALAIWRSSEPHVSFPLVPRPAATKVSGSLSPSLCERLNRAPGTVTYAGRGGLGVGRRGFRTA